jgi:hypothetical protein
MHPIRTCSAILALALALGCSDSSTLSDPTQSNVVDTVTLGSLKHTSIATPSAFQISSGAVRTDQTVDFEFAYDVRQQSDGSAQPVFLPRAALGLSSTGSADPGLQVSADTFDELTRALSNGYIVDAAVPVTVGGVYLVRSRVVCTTLGVPLYGKIEVLEIQDSTLVTFKVLTDLNCGYKDLLPGLPKQ